MSRQSKLPSQKPRSLFLCQKNNPESQKNSLVQYKRKKEERCRIKQIKITVQKQLNKMLNKDVDKLKSYLRKKQELQQAKLRQQQFIQNMRYKQWLSAEKQKQLSKRKSQTSKLKSQIEGNLQKAQQKCILSKKHKANSTKVVLKQWKQQKSNSQIKLFQQNKKKFQEIQTKKVITRQSNTRFFQRKYNRVVKSCRQQLSRSEKQFRKDKQQIQELQQNLVNIKKNSETKVQLIQKINEEIQGIRAQTFRISKSRIRLSTSRLSTPKNVMTSSERTSACPTSNDRYTLRMGSRTCSFPNIKPKIYHNQN